jgi:predicted metal-dependent hydrolase
MKHDTDFYEHGIDLFNQGRFFECHEAWEEIWKRSDGEVKLFYQGLIQAAVAILHAQRGNLAGARSLYEKAREKLDAISDDHMGIALGEMRAALAEFIDAAIRADGSPLPEPPRLRRVGSRTEMSLPKVPNR